MKINERLKQIRLENGFTQKQIADKLGIPQPNYQRWESGKRNPKEENLLQLAEAFDVTYEYLTDTEILPAYQQLSKENKTKAIHYTQELLHLENKKSTDS